MHVRVCTQVISCSFPWWRIISGTHSVGVNASGSDTENWRGGLFEPEVTVD